MPHKPTSFRNALAFFLAGEVAYRSAIPRTGCPYPAESRERVAWLAGWDSAEEEAIDLGALRD